MKYRRKNVLTSLLDPYFLVSKPVLLSFSGRTLVKKKVSRYKPQRMNRVMVSMNFWFVDYYMYVCMGKIMSKNERI